jgi:hypothetical protein
MPKTLLAMVAAAIAPEDFSICDMGQELKSVSPPGARRSSAAPQGWEKKKPPGANSRWFEILASERENYIVGRVERSIIQSTSGLFGEGTLSGMF